MQVTSQDIADALARRRLGYGRGARMKFEQDEIRITGGVRHGLTQGGPISIEIGNTEWPKWEQVMAADPVDPVDLDALARNAALTRPRPGHADLVGMQKYGFHEARPILERASARETAARVALGRLATAFLEQATGARTISHVVRARRCLRTGRVRALTRRPRPPRRRPGALPGPGCLEADGGADRPGPQGRRHPRRRRGGGRARTAARSRLPRRTGTVGWTHGWRAPSMGIQAIKGVEVGDGFETAATPAHGPTTRSSATAESCVVRRDARAAPRAACPRARSSGSGPR